MDKNNKKITKIKYIKLRKKSLEYYNKVKINNYI